jgi:hypothetical protein
MATKKKKKVKARKPSKAAPVDPLDVTVRLTETELLRLGKISAEIQLAMVSARIAVYEGLEAKSKAEADLKKREEEVRAAVASTIQAKESERTVHVQEAQRLRKLYGELTEKLANKYGIDNPNSMVVDPDTGVVRDSRNL